MSANPSKSDGSKFWVQTLFLLSCASLKLHWSFVWLFWFLFFAIGGNYKFCGHFSYYSLSHSEGLNLLICYSWLCIMSCSFDCCICLSLPLYYKNVCTMPLCNTERCPVMLLRLQPNNMYFLCEFIFVLVSDCRSWSSKHNWELQVVLHGMFF